jgi:hypothetical protein
VDSEGCIETRSVGKALALLGAARKNARPARARLRDANRAMQNTALVHECMVQAHTCFDDPLGERISEAGIVDKIKESISCTLPAYGNGRALP